jgi:hypothetical protein
MSMLKAKRMSMPNTAEKTTIAVVHCKKRLVTFPSPARMSLTKLSLAGNNLIIPCQGEFG